MHSSHDANTETSGPDRPRLAELDALRAIAFSLVFVVHAAQRVLAEGHTWPFDTGVMGVLLFVVLGRRRDDGPQACR